MIVDQRARDRLFQLNQNKSILEKVNSQPQISTAKIEKTGVNQLTVSALLLSLVKRISVSIAQISQSLHDVPSKDDLLGIKEAVEKIGKPELPSVVVTRDKDLLEAVKNIKMPQVDNVTVDNLGEIVEQFGPLVEAIQALKLPEKEAQKVEIVNQIDTSKLEAMMGTFGKKISALKANKPAEVDLSEVIDVLSDIRDDLVKQINREPVLPKTISVDNFPAQFKPQPVTNININALQGFVKTTSNTVSTTITRLPSYGQLFNRRALQIYNNSSNTVYFGGSDVTVNNGIPVPAGSFSNIIDAGYNMIIYAVAASGSNNVRVLEVSKDQTGNVQQ